MTINHVCNGGFDLLIGCLNCESQIPAKSKTPNIVPFRAARVCPRCPHDLRIHDDGMCFHEDGRGVYDCDCADEVVIRPATAAKDGDDYVSGRIG